MNAQALNAQFNSIESVSFYQSLDGLVKMVLDNCVFSAEIYLQGAHLTSFHPKNSNEVFWLSPESHFSQGKAIRGGIPVCWPWFGKSTQDESLPQHGFARTTEFSVKSICEDSEKGIIVELVLCNNEQTLKLWPNDFRLEVKFTLKNSLKVELTTYNLNDHPIEISEAIHSYFTVDDIQKVHLEGLRGVTFYNQMLKANQVNDFKRLVFKEETDQIYTCPTEKLLINRADDRKLEIGSLGANSIVVWNPWEEKAAALNDFPMECYREMLCVETANTNISGVSQSVTIRPNQSHTISQTISLSA